MEPEGNPRKLRPGPKANNRGQRHPKDDPDGYYDAVFLSPHKFLGGPGSTGVLVFNKNIYQTALRPTVSGGGTVSYVARHDHDFIEDIEEGWGVALDALEQEDYKRVQAQMHKLGGSCAAVFAVELSKSFYTAEKAVVENNHKNEAFLLLLDKIGVIITQQLCKEIKGYITSS